MRTHLLILVLAVLCIGTIPPALAQVNPYMNAGEVTAADIPVAITSDNVAASDTSGISFEGAGYTHTIGRVSIAIEPRIAGLGAKPEINGNLRSSGTGHTIEYELYRDLIKERITLTSPETVSYSYDLRLSDWVTDEPDESRPGETRDANNTVIITYPHTVRVTAYAKDSTIDINPDRWGNLVVDVNGEGVVVMPRPYAIDATGKRFEMNFGLDKNAQTIAVTGDLAGAEYPITIDPTERVTNGGFETGTTAGWSISSPPPTLTIISGGANQGTYYCRYQGNSYWGVAGYSRMYQTIDYTGVDSASMAVKVFAPNTYDFILSDSYWGAQDTRNYYINFPGQYATGWVTKSATPTLTGDHMLQFWTYYTNYAGIDSISVDPPITAPVADFSATLTSGYSPLTVRFTDTSENYPTSWSWDFGDGDSTNATVQNPVHTYTSAGTYTVELTATNADGSDAEEKVDYITVTEPSDQATNVQGINVSEFGIPRPNFIEDAANAQRDLGYNVETKYLVIP